MYIILSRQGTRSVYEKRRTRTCTFGILEQIFCRSLTPNTVSRPLWFFYTRVLPAHTHTNQHSTVPHTNSHHIHTLREIYSVHVEVINVCKNNSLELNESYTLYFFTVHNKLKTGYLRVRTLSYSLYLYFLTSALCIVRRHYYNSV